ncbi:MAG: glycine--tRNA ligase subunit beta [Nitrospirota bacterium]
MNQNIKNHLSLLLEIGTEEIPARFLPGAIQRLKENSDTILIENYIDFSEIKAYATPRRLALIVKGLGEVQRNRVKEVFGPAKKLAFDSNGRPTEAALRFAKSQGVNVEDLIIKKREKGEYLVSVVEERGIPVKNLLPEILRKLVLSIRFPKTMRWGNGNVRFARPIHYLLAMFGKDVVNFEIDGIRSSNWTRGHYFLSPSEIRIDEISDYLNLLKENFVILDQDERKKMILEGIKRLSVLAGGKPVEDEELLETVNFLVEYPVPVLCNFEKVYLQLPKELLITVMKDHQKYFAIEEDGRLINYFIVVSNTKEENKETIKIGAERVIKARFEDAKFYFEEDRRKPLCERVDELKKVTFQEKLGSLYEKTERLVFISDFLSERLLLSEKSKLIRAALLSKTDLVTGIVREFPELQGTIGKYYATFDGEDREVAEALEEHYLPAHSGGKLPRTDVGALLSIVDKIDNIAAFFSIGLTPTGSEDPFALRRQAFGIISIILNYGYDVSLKDLIDKALEKISQIEGYKKARQNLPYFFEQRIETVLSELGYSSDLIQSILFLSLGLSLKDVRERLDAIKKFMKDEECSRFLLAIKRVNNIIPKRTIPVLKTELLIEPAERHLKAKLDSIRPHFIDLLKERKYNDAIIVFSSLIDPINNFFDHVLVMDKREEIKQNRLALLKEVWETISSVADFSKLPS